MRFKKFRFVNFKGIQDVTINLNKSPKSNVYALVGLNESGKTTLLEAISNYEPQTGPMDKPINTIGKNPNAFVPLSLRDNFNGDIIIEATLEFDEEDPRNINKFANENTIFSEIEYPDDTSYTRYYRFKDSKFSISDYFWTGFRGKLKEKPEQGFIRIWDESQEDWHKIDKFCQEQIPSIIYFPNFLFDFPSRIYLVPRSGQQSKDDFFISLIQDILFSLRNKTKVQEHLINRILSNDPNDEKNLKRLLQRMEDKVTEVVFDSWNEIFKRRIEGSRITIESGIEPNNLPYLEFSVRARDGIYNINERSLGFRWFLTFLMFTQFRPFREGTPKSLIYLFDEPASNLHSSAQNQLLKSFERFGKDVKIIYTTHSHYMINPNWLESTYIVRNKGIDLESPEANSPKQTNILIEPYRTFVSKYPRKTDYFQPILDVLEYKPSDLEKIPNCVFLEGKNDYYTLSYFSNNVLKTDHSINLMPGIGASSLSTLISLYLGWGKTFVILLDSDRAGTIQKKKYEDKLGTVVGSRIFTLSDIDETWDGIPIEDLFEPSERVTFQRTIFPESGEFDKEKFNRAIQECFVTKKQYEWSEESKIKFKKILNFLENKMKEASLEN